MCTATECSALFITRRTRSRRLFSAPGSISPHTGTTLRFERGCTASRHTNPLAESFVERCVAAWRAAGVQQLAALLKAEVVMGAPALGLRLNGRSAVGEFLASVPAFEDRQMFRFIATRANRQPAVAVYCVDEHAQSAAYRTIAIVVLTIDGDVAAAIAVFPDPTLMPVFGLPTEL